MLPLESIPAENLETPTVLRSVTKAARQLAELKGQIETIPNIGMLINTLGLQEAKDSSEIENIVTTHDELFSAARMPEREHHGAAKEVHRYVAALRVGFSSVAKDRLLTVNHILAIQSALEPNKGGVRKVPGTVLKNQDDVVIYTPPDPQEITSLMSDLERFINDAELSSLDPLIKMALIHHRFETIHPFYDGNGRTGRILNVLYLVLQGLIDIPVLYMSRAIIRSKSEYYRLLQSTRVTGDWEPWILYMLSAVEATSADAIKKIGLIRSAIQHVKHRLRKEHASIYSQELINHLFSHPYTRAQFLSEDLHIVPRTARRYLEALSATGILSKRRVGKSNAYVNIALVAVLAPVVLVPVQTPNDTVVTTH